MAMEYVETSPTNDQFEGDIFNESQVNFSDGLQSESGIPLATIILASINTLMYATLAVLIMLDFKNSVELWKRILVASTTIPEYVGFVLWISNNTASTRHIYLLCQYASFFTLVVVSVYHFATTFVDFLIENEDAGVLELTLTGSFMVGFGVMGTIFLMSFQTYAAVMLQFETENVKPFGPSDADDNQEISNPDI